MQTLILNGSPRKNGDTASLLQAMLSRLEGEYHVVDAYHADISPCVDCRYCRTHMGCAIDDGMTEVYREIEACDNIVIASPIYFSELTGRMLDVCSRLQMYFSAIHFRQERPLLHPKRGGVILTGGGAGKPEKPYGTAVCLLHHMGVTDVFPMVCSFDTDAVPAAEDTAALLQTEKLADFLNRKER